MRIGFILSFLLVLLMVGIISGQEVVYYFPAPGDNVVGLGSSIGRVWAIDSGTLNIYELDDDDGEILNQFPVVGTTTPTGLSCGEGVLYYADEGTAVLHAMFDDGSYIGSYDFSDSGILSIRGLGFNNEYPKRLLIADDITNLAYAAYPPLIFDTVEIIADLADAPEVFYDAAVSLGYGAIYLACGNLYYNVQAYDLNGLSCVWEFIEIGMVAGIADFVDLPTDEFLWLSDPEVDSIYLGYYGIGIEEEMTSFSETSFLTASRNPFFNYVEFMGSIDGQSELLITDITGRLVEQTAFTGYFFWDGCDIEGNVLPSGTYLVMLTLETGTESLKLIKLM